MSLTVPDLPDDVDSLTAALAYAAAGWYVAPVAQGTKNPGSVLGASWPSRTTRDARDIAALWAGTSHGVALHAGRSGAVVLDVDHPDQVPTVLSDSLSAKPPPMQSTRPDDPRRGHYLYAMPPGRDIGNGNGDLGKAWGDVRGRNGVIVVAPSVHPNGGAYAWRKTGPVPVLPPHLADLLPDSAPTAAVATDEQVVAFLRAHTTRQRPQLLQAVLGKLDAALEARESRHNSTVEALCWAMREARAGLYTATEAATAIQARFAAVKPEAGNGEWAGMVAWAISHANLVDPDDIRRATNDRAPDVDAWLDTLREEPVESMDRATDIEQSNLNPLPFLTLAELRAKVAAAGPRRWLIRGLWPAGDYGIHAAEQKAQKTWNTADLAVSVASGTPWLGAHPVDQPGPVLMFVGEGGEGNTARRLEAICEARGLDPDALPIHICTRAPHLNDTVHLSLMVAKLEAIRPALVTLDPLYLAARGAELGDLYKMGALLEAPQIMCQNVGASLFVVTHFNRKQGSGSGRITGAGPAEWGRVLITSTVKSRATDPTTKATDVVSLLETIGGEIPDQAFRVHRRIWSDDPDDLDAPLHITTSIDEVDDAAAVSTPGGEKLPPAAQKLLEALQTQTDPVPSSKLVDHVKDTHGHGLTRETASRNLNKLLDLGLVDSIEGAGRFEPTLWFLSRDPRDVTRDDHAADSRVTSVTAPKGGHTSHGHTSHHDPDVTRSHDTDHTQEAS